MGDPTTDKDSPGYSQNQRWQDQQAPDSGARNQQWEGYHLSDLSHSQRKVNNSHTAYISGSLPISMLCRELTVPGRLLISPLATWGSGRGQILLDETRPQRLPFSLIICLNLLYSTTPDSPSLMLSLL